MSYMLWPCFSYALNIEKFVICTVIEQEKYQIYPFQSYGVSLETPSYI